MHAIKEHPLSDQPQPPRRLGARRRLVRLLLRAALALIVLWLAAGAFASWKLTRRPRSPFDEPPPTIDGRVMQNHRLYTSDGEEVGAWFLTGHAGRGTVLFLHGIGGSRSMFSNLFAPLARDGYGVLAVSLRSHGDSTGAAHDVGYSARHDVISAVEFLERERPGEPIVVCGSSFGGAAAAYASAELGVRVHAYVFDSLYADLRSALWNRLDHYLPPGLDYLAYAGFRLWAPVFLPVKLDLLRPCDPVSQIPESIPLVFAAGSKDFRSPPSEARAMYETVQSHAKFVEFPGAGHSLLNANDPATYVRNLEVLFSEESAPEEHKN